MKMQVFLNEIQMYFFIYFGHRIQMQMYVVLVLKSKYKVSVCFYSNKMEIHFFKLKIKCISMYK